MTRKRVGICYPVGEFVREEMQARGWTRQQLADRAGLQPRVIHNLILARHFEMSDEVAQGLSRAFGTSANIWMNLHNAYVEYVAAIEDADDRTT